MVLTSRKYDYLPMKNIIFLNFSSAALFSYVNRLMLAWLDFTTVIISSRHCSAVFCKNENENFNSKHLFIHPLIISRIKNVPAVFSECFSF